MLRTGEGVSGSFAINPTIAPDDNIVVGQRLAVVLLGTTRGGQGDRTLCDIQWSITNGNSVVFLEVFLTT